MLAACVVACACGDASAAGKALNPFRRAQRKRYSLHGTFYMSDGVKLEGPTRLKGRKVFKIYDRVNMRHREFPLSEVTEVLCEIGEEKLEKIWRWKEGGEHVKIDTGQSYPVRKFVYKLKLVPDEDDGDEAPIVEGGMSGVIFVELSSRLTVDDIADWPGFCAKLRKEAKEANPNPSKRLWLLLPPEAQQAAEGVSGPKGPDQEGKCLLIKALNEVLGKPEFYQEQDFAGVELPEVTKRYLQRGPRLLKERQLLWLNRLILDTAYPKHIRKSPVETGGSETKLWYNETLGDKTMIGKKLEDLVYVKRMVFRSIGEQPDGTR